MTPIADWLRETRERQVNPSTGKSWSQGYMAQRLEEELGWRLGRENYNKYETGKTTPNPETLKRFVDFWTSHGEAAPNLASGEPPLSIEERTVRAMERQAEAAERQATAMEMHVRLLARQTIATEAIAARQGATLPEGPDLLAMEDELLALAQRVLDGTRSRSPQSDPLHAAEG